MASTLNLRGTVKAPTDDLGGRPTRVVVTRGGSVIAESPVDPDGGIDVSVPAGDDVLITIIGQDGRVLRRRLEAGRRAVVDIGSLEMAATEFPAGISGQAWNAADDQPLTGGSVTLRLDDAVVGSSRLNASGEFTFELTEFTPLPPGQYRVVVEVPGYRAGERSVDVAGEVTSYRLGRVELTAQAARLKG